MLIGKRYKLESDSLNVTLFKKRKRTRKSDETKYEDWEIIGYFATPSNALHELVDLGVRDTELKDLKTITSAITALHTSIESLPKTYRAIPRATPQLIDGLALKGEGHR